MPTMLEKLTTFLRKSAGKDGLTTDEVVRVAITKSIEAQIDAVLADKSLAPEAQVEKAEAIIKAYEDETGDTESFGPDWINAQMEKDDDDDDGADDGDFDEDADEDADAGDGESDGEQNADDQRTPTQKEDQKMPESIKKELEDKIETLQKSLTAQTEAVEKMRADKALGEAKEKVTKMLGLIPGDIPVLAVAIQKLDPAEVAALEKVLVAANEQAKIAGLTVEKGTNSTTEGETPLAVAVATIRKADPTLSEAQATDKALTANPKLYTTKR